VDGEERHHVEDVGRATLAAPIAGGVMSPLMNESDARRAASKLSETRATPVLVIYDRINMSRPFFIVARSCFIAKQNPSLEVVATFVAGFEKDLES
jgi:hypothetical protein